MSALAHWLEEEGIATTLVALFRPHAETVRPPRALWVPFALGRPMGPPNDAGFQREVLTSALRLLESDGPAGPIVDFERDDPDGAHDPDWVCPIPAGASDLLGELHAVLPHYERAVTRFGRTTVGLAALPIDAVARFLAAYAVDENCERPRTGMAPASLMRFCADDLKACYLEAAASGEGSPSAGQLMDWFWHDTIAGKTIRTIREGSASSTDKQRQAIGVKSLIPGIYL